MAVKVHTEALSQELVTKEKAEDALSREVDELKV